MTIFSSLHAARHAAIAHAKREDGTHRMACAGIFECVNGSGLEIVPEIEGWSLRTLSEFEVLERQLRYKAETFDREASEIEHVASTWRASTRASRMAAANNPIVLRARASECRRALMLLSIARLGRSTPLLNAIRNAHRHASLANRWFAGERKRVA